MESPTESLFTVFEVADRLKVHHQTVRIYIKSGELGHVMMGTRLRVTGAQLAQFIDEHSVPAS